MALALAQVALHHFTIHFYRHQRRSSLNYIGIRAVLMYFSFMSVRALLTATALL